MKSRSTYCVTNKANYRQKSAWNIALGKCDLRVLSLILATRNLSTTANVVGQETFIRAWTAICYCDQGTGIAAFFFRIAVKNVFQNRNGNCLSFSNGPTGPVLNIRRSKYHSFPEILKQYLRWRNVALAARSFKSMLNGDLCDFIAARSNWCLARNHGQNDPSEKFYQFL